MTTMEYRITRQLLARRQPVERPRGQGRWPERLIATLAVTACLVGLGSLLQELLWAALASATVIGLGVGNKT